jgi:Ca-activated chloride channel family protein
VLIPGLIVLFIWVVKWKQKSIRKIGDPKLVGELIKNYSPKKFAIKFGVAALALATIILAAANLQQKKAMDEVNRKGVDLMIAMDVSKSMWAEDVSPNRLERAKQLVTRLVDNLDNDRIGIVLFAGRAYVQMPLTADHAAAKMYIQTASPESVPAQGTVIAEALKISNAAFNSKDRKFKSIILISDGEDHDADALKTAQSLAQNGVMINTVGIGSGDGVPIIDHETNQIRKDAEGHAIITKLNEAELQELAKATNGVYVKLEDVNNAVSTISNKLKSIEQQSMTDAAFIDYKTYFYWFIAAAMIFLIAELFIPERKMIPA